MITEDTLIKSVLEALHTLGYTATTESVFTDEKQKTIFLSMLSRAKMQYRNLPIVIGHCNKLIKKLEG